MINKSKYFFSFLVLVFLFTSGISLAQTLEVDPLMEEVEQGEEFDIELVFENDGTVTGITTLLTFDSSILEVVNTQAGPATQGLLFVVLPPSASGNDGQISLVVNSMMDPIPDGIVLVTTFRALMDGQTVLNIDNTVFSNANEEEVDGDTTNGTVNVGDGGMPEPMPMPSPEPMPTPPETSEPGDSSSGCGSIVGSVPASASVLNLLILAVPGLVIFLRRVRSKRK